MPNDAHARSQYRGGDPPEPAASGDAAVAALVLGSLLLITALLTDHKSVQRDWHRRHAAKGVKGQVKAHRNLLPASVPIVAQAVVTGLKDPARPCSVEFGPNRPLLRAFGFHERLAGMQLEPLLNLLGLLGVIDASFRSPGKQRLLLVAAAR